MNPSPTIEARLLAVVMGLALLVGTIASSVPLVALASAGMAFLGAVYVATIPFARRARADRLEFAWWLGNEPSMSRDGMVAAGSPFTIRGFFRHRAARTFASRVSSPYPRTRMRSATTGNVGSEFRRVAVPNSSSR